MAVALACLAAFALGSVPFGLLLVKVFAGVDLRQLGSGNVGATNAARAFASRAAGLAVFLVIYVLDAGKGLLPALLGPGWIGREGDLLSGVLMGAAAILGHCFSPVLGFKGGKGVATATGVILALDPVAFAAAIAVFGVVVLCTRQVFLGSLALGLTLAAAVIGRDLERAFSERLPLTLFSFFLALFMFYTHRSNIKKAYAAGRKAPS